MAADPHVRRQRLVPLLGRDPLEQHRVATPLELFFDLSFVVVFRVTADQLAHGLATGQFLSAGAAFAFAIVATCWAWTNYSWFSSAYDTDDWSHRSTTAIQMAGVIVLAAGLPGLFRSVEEGEAVDIGVVVAGYVVMRVAMATQWLRVARQDHIHRRTAVSYAVWIGIAQSGWVLLAFARPSPTTFFPVAVALFVIEALGPITAERRSGGTPWNPHHIAERYGLLTLIALGECLFGTVAVVTGVVDGRGWHLGAISVIAAGSALTLGMWWVYFAAPTGDLLARHRDRAFVWAYSHILILGAIVATAAGLDAADFVVAGDAAISGVQAMAAIAAPALVFVCCVALVNSYMRRPGVGPDPSRVAADGPGD